MAHSTPVDRGVIVIAEMRIVPVVLIAAGIVAAAAAANAQTAPAPASSGLTVERVAQLPSIIGTAPASPTWSPDSRWIAFRWNESGWPFRDVYVVRADGTGLKRLTDMQRTDPAPAPPAGTSTDALAAQAAARARGGVSEVQWLPDSRGLLFVSRGSVFRIGIDGGEPQKLGAGDGVSDIALSPDGSSLAFLRDGDIWLWALGGAAAAERLTTLGVEGIGRVPLGTYNRADVEVGTGVWGADWPPFAWSPDGRTIAFHMSDRRHLRKVPFPYYLGAETTVNELRRGYPGDENERRSLGLLRVETRQVQMIPLEQPGARGISDYQWSSSGRLLVDQVSDTGAERWLFVVDAGGGDAEAGVARPTGLAHLPVLCRALACRRPANPGGRGPGRTRPSVYPRRGCRGAGASGGDVRQLGRRRGTRRGVRAGRGFRRRGVLHRHREESLRTSRLSRGPWGCRASGHQPDRGRPRARGLSRWPARGVAVVRRCDADGADGDGRHAPARPSAG